MKNFPILELFFYKSCPYCQHVLSVIETLGIKVIFCNTRTNEEFSKKIFKDTGRTTVPCLYIDGVPMHESRDIISWLEENEHLLEKIS